MLARQRHRTLGVGLDTLRVAGETEQEAAIGERLRETCAWLIARECSTAHDCRLIASFCFPSTNLVSERKQAQVSAWLLP